MTAHSVSDRLRARYSLAPQPITTVDCKKHGPRQSVFIDAAGNAQGCTHCALEAVGAREVRALNQQRQAARQGRLERMLGAACIPERYTSVGFDSYVAEQPGQQLALRVCQGYAEDFPARAAAGASLLLLGSLGTGKTHLGVAIANTVVNRHQRTALYVRAAQLLRVVRGAFNRDADYSESNAFARFIEPDLLVLDEVGAHKPSDYSQSAMFEVLNGRYEKGRPTVLISNHTMDSLPVFLGEAVVDRLRQSTAGLVPFQWESYRR